MPHLILCLSQWCIMNYDRQCWWRLLILWLWKMIGWKWN